MEGKFSDFVTEELRTLLAEHEAGLQPSNIVLSEVVIHELRKQHERKV